MCMSVIPAIPYLFTGLIITKMKSHYSKESVVNVNNNNNNKGGQVTCKTKKKFPHFEARKTRTRDHVKLINSEHQKLTSICLTL